MNKTLLGVLAVAGAITAIAVSGRALLTDTEKPLPASSEPPRVSRHEAVALVKATGVVKPPAGAEVQVGSQRAGLVRDLRVEVGDTVQKGQLLFALDAREVVARRDEVAATLLSAQTTLHFEQLELDRRRQLVLANAASPSELEGNERRVALAQAAEAAARASLALCLVEVDHMQVKAPIAGIVAAVFLHRGEMVTNGPAPTPVLTLMDLSALEVRAYIDETDIGRVAVGQPASFTVDAFADRAITGVVTGIYPKPEIRDNVVSYVTVVRITEPNRPLLRPEMTASVRISLSAAPLAAGAAEPPRLDAVVAPPPVATEVARPSPTLSAPGSRAATTNPRSRADD